MSSTFNGQPNTPEEVNSWVDWLLGKEQDATHGAIARFVQANVKRRPASGGAARWQSFDELHSINAYYKYIDPAELEASITAFRAAGIN